MQKSQWFGYLAVALGVGAGVLCLLWFSHGRVGAGVAMCAATMALLGVGWRALLEAPSDERERAS
jgi:hypothetical protein